MLLSTRLPGALAAAFAVAACGAGGATDPDAAPGGDAAPRPDADPGDPFPDTHPAWGAIEVLEIEAPWERSSVVRAVFNREPTRQRFVFYFGVAVIHLQRETRREGSCRLLENVPAFCSDCDGLCVDTETCEPFPEYTSAGTLTISGLAAPRELEANPWYISFGSEGSFAADATIAASAPGAAVPGFSVSVGAVPRLVVDIDDHEIEIVDGEDFELTWTPEDPTTRVRLTLNANNFGHAMPYEAILECDAADIGSLTIPAALIEAFPETERWETCAGSDCPMSHVRRYREAATEVEGGDVTLLAGSEIQFYVIHRRR